MIGGEVVGDALVHAYAGKESGLVWWSGPTGQLRPEMPVLAPDQIRGTRTIFGSVREGLEQVWIDWMADGDRGRGPTAASALLAWLRDSLDVALQVDEELEQRNGEWIAHDAPLELTAPTDGPTSFRLHRDDRIVDWFEERAWEHRLSRGRSGVKRERPSQVVDRQLDVPTWYNVADPLAELPDAERAELLDWLRALTGRAPRDDAPRYHGASRRALGEIIGLLCEHDERLAELREAQSGGPRTEVAQIRADLRALRAALADSVSHATRRRVTNFDVEAAVEARAAHRRAGARDESRRAFYLRIVRDWFGEDAARDENLRLFALCVDGAPLLEYTDLFHIDDGAGNIWHTLEFGRRFARATGTHSECVARRLARELWELRRRDTARRARGQRGERLLERTDELLDWLDTMAAYRVPCPAALERELRDRLEDTSPELVREEWDRWQRELETRRAGEGRGCEVLATMAEPEEVHRAAVAEEFRRRMKENTRAGEHLYTTNATAFVPSPIALLFTIFCE